MPIGPSTISSKSRASSATGTKIAIGRGGDAAAPELPIAKNCYGTSSLCEYSSNQNYLENSSACGLYRKQCAAMHSAQKKTPAEGGGSAGVLWFGRQSGGGDSRPYSASPGRRWASPKLHAINAPVRPCIQLSIAHGSLAKLCGAANLRTQGGKPGEGRIYATRGETTTLQDALNMQRVAKRL